MNLSDIVKSYLDSGYTNANAVSKMCQDIILLKIKKTSLSKNITIKGGVVLMALSNDKRRATQDLDIDFIKYSLDDNSITAFINKLSDKDVKFSITAPIKKLSHQDYDGKRVFVKLSDAFGNKYGTKLDIGVHNNFDVLQDEFCFDLEIINNSISLLVNSKEQIFVEKLKSLLKHAIRSTRYKDIFDFYYLINNTDLDKKRLIEYLDKFILLDNNMKETNISDIEKNLKTILTNIQFLSMLNIARNNWLELQVDEVIESILKFFESLEVVEV